MELVNNVVGINCLSKFLIELVGTLRNGKQLENSENIESKDLLFVAVQQRNSTGPKAFHV
jgi:hypothetical protein